MKSIRILCVALGLILSAGQAHAIFGVGDIVFDPTAAIKWVAQAEQMATQINQLSQQINQYNTMINQGRQIAAVVGDPKSVLQSVSSARGALQQFAMIYDDQTGSNTRSLLTASDNLGNSIGTTMNIGKQPVRRDLTLYEAYRVGNSLSKNLEAQLERDNGEQKRIAQQRKAILDEMAAKEAAGTLTQTDISKYEMALSALKGQQDASAQAVANARNRLEEEESNRKRLTEMDAKAREEQNQAENNLVTNAIATSEKSTDQLTKDALNTSTSPWGGNQVDQRTFGSASE